MRCKQCKHEFCWLCMSNWRLHRSCNNFEGEGKDSDSKVNRAKAELERYLHCYDRFQNHSRGHKFARSDLGKVNKIQDDYGLEEIKKTEQERKHSVDKIDFEFWDKLKQALRQLVECRRVLKYTYVVAYFLDDDHLCRDLFQDQQARLEAFTEKLSSITEQDYAKIDRIELADVTGAVATYTKNVMNLDLHVDIKVQVQSVPKPL